MTTALLSPQNPKFMLLLLLGVGAFMMTRRAGAGTLARGAASTPQGAAMRYSISPGTAQAQGVGLGAQVSALSTLLNVGKSVLNGISPGRTASSPFGDYFPSAIGTGVSAEADGTIGEGAAQSFYQSHMSDFQAPDPIITDSMIDRATLEGLSEY